MHTYMLDHRSVADAVSHGSERGFHVLRRSGIGHNDGGQFRHHLFFQGEDLRGIHCLHVGVALFLGGRVLDVRRLAGDASTTSDQFVGHENVQDGQHRMGIEKQEDGDNENG